MESKHKSFKVASSRIEDGREICNTCGREASKPYRYRTPDGQRGCIASCHDSYVRFSRDADWVTNKRFRLPKWITEARGKIENFERCVSS